MARKLRHGKLKSLSIFSLITILLVCTVNSIEALNNSEIRDKKADQNDISVASGIAETGRSKLIENEVGSHVALDTGSVNQVVINKSDSNLRTNGSDSKLNSTNNAKESNTSNKDTSIRDNMGNKNEDIFRNENNLTQIEAEILDLVDESTNDDHIPIIEGVLSIDKINQTNSPSSEVVSLERRSTKSFSELLMDSYENFINSHTVTIRRAGEVSTLARLVPRTNSFMTGFGLGFLAFGIKKLLLPVFIGAQIVKSVLIAMFLPSILGGLGKLVGKGLSSFSGASSQSNHQQLDDFDFKDPQQINHEMEYGTPAGSSETADNSLQDYSAAGDSSFGYPSQTMNKMQSAMAVQQAMNRYSAVGHKVTYVPQQSDSYYLPKPSKNSHQNYKVFHKIPASSLLLTSYDPFYSPLLSRLDAIFKQIAIGNSEKCRERMVCLMYANPTKYAPYSNLISAQLSRELNELRKPTSDNPDILRFFKYMKAAKDGQDGSPDCPQHLGCPELMSVKTSPAMLTTYNEINKLVQARHLK